MGVMFAGPRMPMALWLLYFVVHMGAQPTCGTKDQCVSNGSSTAYHWPHARGNIGKYSFTEEPGPPDLYASLAWKFYASSEWKLPNLQRRSISTIVSSPLIDDKMNIYLALEEGIFKFSPDGEHLWVHQPQGLVSSCPSLLDGALYGNTDQGYVYAISMETGTTIWTAKVASDIGRNTGYVEAHDGVVITGAATIQGNCGNKKLFGLNASDGSFLWEFTPDSGFFNQMPVFAGDGTFVLQDYEGRAYRLTVAEGRLIWKAGGLKHSVTGGGTTLGPNQVVYTVGIYGRDGQDTPGFLRAYRLEDGELLWDSIVPRPPNSWPVVGKLHPRDGLSVVIPIGQQAGPPGVWELPGWWSLTAKMAIHKLSLMLGDASRFLWNNKGHPMDVYAFDAETGRFKWKYEAPEWKRKAPAGIEERLQIEHFQAGRVQPTCFPGPWTAPTISSDGTVWVGNQNGKLYKIKDTNADDKLDPNNEVWTFDTGSSALHPGTSFAPGMLAYADADGLFVWKY